MNQFNSIKSVEAVCPDCNHLGKTKTSTTIGSNAFIASGVLCLIGCWLCCCFPCCLRECLDTKHRCEKCGNLLGQCKNLEAKENEAQGLTNEMTVDGGDAANQGREDGNMKSGAIEEDEELSS